MADERIIENINKLKALGMNDKDIIDSLVNIGLSKEESEELVLSKEKETELDKKVNDKKEKISDKKQDVVEKKEEVKKPEVKEEKKDEIPDDFFSSKDDSTKNELNKLKEISDSKKDDFDFSINLNDDYIPKTKDLDKENEIELETDDNYIKDTLFEEKPIENNINKEVKQSYKEDSFVNNDDSGNDGLWQKGLLTTINSKLIELESKQKEIEDSLKRKIETEVVKLETFQENTRDEIKKSVKNIISQEVSELNKKIITDLAKFKVTESKINSKIQSIDDNKEKLENTVNSYESIKNDLKQNVIENKEKIDSIITKAEQNITKTMTTMTIKLNQKVKEFDGLISQQSQKNDALVSKTQDNISKIVSTISGKLNEKVKEINNTLSLQTKITEGLVKTTQNNVNNEIKKLNEFQKELVSKIDLKKITERLLELDKYKEQLAKRYDERFDVVKQEFLQKARVSIKSEVDTNISEIRDIKKFVSERTNPKILDEKLSEFEKTASERMRSVFNEISQEKIKEIKEYTESIDKNKEDAINEINEHIKELEKSKDDYHKNRKLQREIDEKVRDLEEKYAKQERLTANLVDETEGKINEQIKKLDNFQKSVVSKIDPKRIYETINEIEEFKVKIAKRFEDKFSDVKQEFLQKARISITSVVKESLDELETVKKEIVEKTDPEIIEKKLSELENFEQGILDSIDSKVMEAIKIYQASLTAQFKEKMDDVEKYKKTLEKTVGLQMRVEDQVKEIEMFKKQFIAVIDENIEKINKNMQMLASYKK